TREQYSLQRVAIDATRERQLLSGVSGHAHDPLCVGELQGEPRGRCDFLDLQIQLGGLRGHIDGSARQLISDGPDATRVFAWFHSVAREALLALGVACGPGAD